MVLSYLASYVYTPSSASSSSSSSSSGSGSSGPAPSRANSVRRTTGGRHGASSRASRAAAAAAAAAGKTRSNGTIAEDVEDEKGKETTAASATADEFQLPNDDPALALIHYINSANSLYDVVGISKTFTSNDDLRRAYMARCRVCHPDKFPNYSEGATSAFQRVSLAYETLSKPNSRKAYDLSGAKNGFAGPDNDPLGADFGDETLRSVLYTMYCEFLEKGDFEMVRVLVEALNASNPGLNLGEEAIEGIEGALKRLRSMLLAGAKHFRIVKFELIRLYEIQHDLRQLSYFDVFGRLRLSLQLARVTLSIPMAIDKAMREDDEYSKDGPPAAFVEDDADGSDASRHQVVKKGLLGPRVAGVLGLAVAILEKGERII